VPTYDYQCRSCGTITEVVHSMLEDGPTTCERCGGELRRVFHPTGIIFRGGGFYKTDSRSSSSGTVGGSSRSEGSGDAAQASSTSKETGTTTEKGSAPKTSGDAGKGASATD
jgi:putative FmdB family regulatory protein